MTNLEYLQKEDELCNAIWLDHLQKDYTSKLMDGLWHEHICDFYLINRITGRSHANTRSKRQCKEYLKSIGQKRDINLNCCDQCPHKRYVTIKNNFIMNICSCGISDDNSKNYFYAESLKQIH